MSRKRLWHKGEREVAHELKPGMTARCAGSDGCRTSTALASSDLTPRCVGFSLTRRPVSCGWCDGEKNSVRHLRARVQEGAPCNPARGRRDGAQRVLRSVVQGGRTMRVKYFSDTDTALLEFTDKPVAETRRSWRRTAAPTFWRSVLLPGLMIRLRRPGDPDAAQWRRWHRCHRDKQARDPAPSVQAQPVGRHHRRRCDGRNDQCLRRLGGTLGRIGHIFKNRPFSPQRPLHMHGLLARDNGRLAPIAERSCCLVS